MVQQDERNYFSLQVKVLNWLLQYKANNCEWFTFHLSTAQTSQFPFPGRGRDDFPNKFFYLDLITARGNNSRYHLRLYIYLNDDYSLIQSVKLNLGIGGGADA